MNITRKAIVLCLTAAAFCTLSAGEKDPEKKLIVGGFEIGMARTAHLARNAEKFEKFPFDGLFIGFHLPNNKYQPASNKFMTSRVKWEKEWFAQEVADLKKISSGRLKHNFLNMFWSPSRHLKWNDDEAWERCIHNAAVIAWMAREGGCAGVNMDVEDYTLRRQFFHRPADGTYEESAALARKRGQQVMKALTKEYPNIVIFTFMLFCETNMIHQGTDVFELAKNHGDLWIHFVNGMLDVIPPDVKIVEGNEHSFWMNASTDDFPRSLADMKSNYARIAYPENRDKYRTQVSCGFAMYMDSYTKALERKTPLAEVRQRFVSNFGDAWRYTDEYVWFQCEGNRWLDNWDEEALKMVNSHTRIQKETWEQLVPGTLRSIETVKNPEKFGEEQLKEGRYANLLRNPDCVKTPPAVQDDVQKLNDWHQGDLPAGWNFWPEKDLKKVSVDTTQGYDDKSSLRVEGSHNGAFTTIVPVSSGKFYAVEGFCKGDGKIYLNVRWQKKGWFRQWAGTCDRILVFHPNAKDGWKRAFTVIQCPEGADKMVLLPSVRQEENEKCNFDKFTVFELK